MKQRFVHFLAIAAVFVALIGTPISVTAQCPMCKMSAESNLKNGGTDGLGLNAGILYMLALPYLIVGGIAYTWWRNRNKEPKEVTEFSEEDFARYNPN